MHNIPFGRYSMDIRLRICSAQEPVFGSGICHLLKKTAQYESLKAAADSMGMSYKKALFIVKRAETHFGTPLLVRSTGGFGGGGSTLTPFAVELTNEFCKVEQKLIRYTEELSLIHLQPLLSDKFSSEK